MLLVKHVQRYKLLIKVLDGDLNIEQDGFLFDILTPKQMYEDKARCTY